MSAMPPDVRPAGAVALDEPAASTPPSAMKSLRRFLAKPSGALSISMLLVFLVTGLLGPFFVDRPGGLGSEILRSPSVAHWFGTDDLGQDVFAQVVWGTRVSLTVAIAASAIAIVIGTALGLLGAYSRRADAWVTTVTDLMLSLPLLPLMIMVTALAGPSVTTLTFVIGLFSWPEVTRLIRSNGLVVVSMPYIDGARALGATGWRIVTREVLPAVVPLIVVSVLLTAARAVISEAGLSFLGLGDPDSWSWGRIILNAQRSGVISTAWWQTLFPSLAILLLVLSATVAGVRFNDSRDPRLKDR